MRFDCLLAFTIWQLQWIYDNISHTLSPRIFQRDSVGQGCQQYGLQSPACGAACGSWTASTCHMSWSTPRAACSVHRPWPQPHTTYMACGASLACAVLGVWSWGWCAHCMWCLRLVQSIRCMWHHTTCPVHWQAGPVCGPDPTCKLAPCHSTSPQILMSLVPLL